MLRIFVYNPCSKCCQIFYQQDDEESSDADETASNSSFEDLSNLNEFNVKEEERENRSEDVDDITNKMKNLQLLTPKTVAMERRLQTKAENSEDESEADTVSVNTFIESFANFQKHSFVVVFHTNYMQLCFVLAGF